MSTVWNESCPLMVSSNTFKLMKVFIVLSRKNFLEKANALSLLNDLIKKHVYIDFNLRCHIYLYIYKT